jgi:alkylation response protein AidB-like acyl-CoA dehydrogenase
LSSVRSFKDDSGGRRRYKSLPPSSLLIRITSPGRIHHCMRSIGSAQRALDMMLTRVSDPVRKTFGKYLREHGMFWESSSWSTTLPDPRAPSGTILTEIAKSRAEIDQARLLVLTAAHQIDVARPKGAMKDIGVAKVCGNACLSAQISASRADSPGTLVYGSLDGLACR